MSEATARLEPVKSIEWDANEQDREIFEIVNLAVGKPAPEIDGEDLAGVSFKLSDYLGKVVMLDFWGDW